MLEKIIFRTERNPYINGKSFLAVYPECPARPGFYAARPFYFDVDGKAVFECFSEISYGYYYGKTRIVHKEDKIIKQLLSVIERFDDCNYLVSERIHTEA